MADIAWFVHRLNAMSIPEITWRVSQKIKQKKEQYQFKRRKTAVTAFLFNKHLETLQFDADRMHLNLKNKNFQLCDSIPLLGGYSYETYKNKWNAGFQTSNHWPEKFSYSLEYKQCDNVGDARTNWELNRHFQFALLAKNYFASRDIKYLTEFEKLFNDWNDKNPFLWGISWTSVMEVAIRCSNWCYAYCFLVNTDTPQMILNKLMVGIVNMTDYIVRHYSRYSSANNHLIIEAYAIGQVGILCNYEPWIAMSVKILTRELTLQNYSDGINKELALHYQSFYMEAMGLLMRLMIKNGIEVPETWITMLDKMCKYMSTCMGKHGEVIVFGDDDGGKILDLQGGLEHYQYVLGMFSSLLGKRYMEGIECCENLAWLFTDAEWNAPKKELFKPQLSACYQEGGNTILRSRDGRILIGIDHAALGFGHIAAHGHADALSFQMFVDGYPLFIDPGTYIYHCDLESRNAFRKTQNHNTVCIDGKDQSEMIGAFLWGRKAECKLTQFTIQEGRTTICASHNGYKSVAIARRYEFGCDDGRLEIEDDLEGKGIATGFFILNPDVSIKLEDHEAEIVLNNIRTHVKCSERLEIGETDYSTEYGIKGRTKVLMYKHNFKGIAKILTEIEIEALSYEWETAV